MSKIIILILLCVFTETLSFQCPVREFYPDPSKSSNYYECVKGEATNMACPDGQLFDEAARTCVKPDSSSAKYKIVCYFSPWVEDRNKEVKITPSQIDPLLCTHINYAFARLDPEAHTIEMEKSDVDEGYYKDMMDLKKKNPNLKVMLSLGGFLDLEATAYSDLAGSETARKNINSNAVKFLQKYGFDGLDLYWDYPSCYQGQCEDNSKDKENFATWLKELRTLFDEQSPRLLLSVAVSPVVSHIDKAYDIPTLNSALDFINVKGYDYSKPSDAFTGQNAPLNAGPGMDPNLTVAATMMNWKEKGVSPNKLILGFPAYGVSFTLKSPESHSFGSPRGPIAEPGPITRVNGLLAYFEICKYLNEGWIKGGDDKAGPFAYSGNQWVGYDDLNAVDRKALFIKEHGFGGAMIFDVTVDDYKGGCCGVNFPLLNVANIVLNGNGNPFSDVACQ